MGTPWNGRSEVERMAKRIKELEDQVRALQSAGTHLPFVDADPDPQYGNVWGFNDNRVRLRKPDGTIREIVTTAPGSSSTGTGLPAAAAQPQTFQSVWSASWSQTYMQSGGKRNESWLHVGYGDSYNGIQTSLIGLPYATIQTALAGSTITAVELYLYCTHCWWNNGSDLFVASHNNTAAPASLAGITTGMVSSFHVQGTDQGGAQGWHSISTQFGGWLRAGSCLGLALQAPSNSVSYYSVHAGVGSGSPVPQIRITYVK